MTDPTYVPVPATCELWISGTRFADGRPAELTSDPVALSGLKVTWGRRTSVDQPPPATCTFTVLDPPGGVRFDAAVPLGASCRIWSELGSRRVIVFDGRVTDLDASYSDDDGGASVAVVAADLTADLGNRFIGDDPWPQETLATRVGRILTLAAGGQTAQLDPRPAAVLVGRMDADRQGAMPLLEDLASSSGSVLWSAVDPTTGAYLLYEDPALRAAGSVLIQYSTGLWGPSEGSAGAGLEVDACLVLQDPLHWFLDTTDLLTRATVRWQDQATAPDPTERVVTIVDTDLEASHGARGISISTMLTTAQAASQLATAAMAAHASATAWRSTGLTWDLAVSEDNDPATQTLAMALLDNNSRIGLLLSLVNLPEWTPVTAAINLFVEGGTYEYAEGRWTLALDTVPSTGTGLSVTYAQMPDSVRDVDMDPTVSYADLLGVGPPVYSGSSWAAATGTWAAATGSWMEN
jgi:hypothetical protein